MPLITKHSLKDASRKTVLFFTHACGYYQMTACLLQFHTLFNQWCIFLGLIKYKKIFPWGFCLRSTMWAKKKDELTYSLTNNRILKPHFIICISFPVFLYTWAILWNLCLKKMFHVPCEAQHFFPSVPAVTALLSAIYLKSLNSGLLKSKYKHQTTLQRRTRPMNKEISRATWNTVHSEYHLISPYQNSCDAQGTWGNSL